MVRILMIRHGDDLAKSVAYRSADKSLNSTGIKQAQKLTKYLKENNYNIDEIYSSQIKRAKETATIIADAYGLDVNVDENLRDADFGKYSGLSNEEAKDKFPEHHKRRSKDKINVPYPDGESYRDLYERLRKVIDPMLENKDKTIAIVSHVPVIRAFQIFYLDEKVKGPSAHVDNCSLTDVEFTKDGKYNIKKLNYSGHL